MPENEKKETKEENLFEKNVAAESQPENTKDLLKTTTPEGVTEEVEETTTEVVKIIKTAGFSKEAPKEFERVHAKIQLTEDWPKEGRVLTIKNVDVQKVRSNDTIQTSTYGQYYKKKLIVDFEESRKLTIDDEEVELPYVEYISSIIYGIKDGVVQPPKFPKACEKEDLTDQYTKRTAKMRYQFLQAFPKTDEKQSDYDFKEALKGKKVLTKKFSSQYPDPENKGLKRKYALLEIVEFVKE